MAKKREDIGRMPNGSEIRLAPQDKVEDYQYELEEILDIIGYSGALITDRSSAGNFFSGEGEKEEEEKMNAVLREIGGHFGIDMPRPDDLLVDIARRVRDARKRR